MPPRSRYLQWFRLVDHDVDEATRKMVRHRWARHWGSAVLHGALCAAMLVGVHQMLTRVSAAPVGGVVAALGSLLAALAFLGLHLAAGMTTTSYGVVWLVETVRGQCSRPIGVVAVGVAATGTALSVVAFTHAAPTVHRWITDSLTTARAAVSGAGPHPILSAEVAGQVTAAMPWLAVATAIAATIWFGPHSGPKSNPVRSGRLDYRTVDATGYLPAPLIDQYRDRKRGNADG